MLATNGGRRYEVHCSAEIAQEIKSLQAQATADGQAKQFIQALRTIGRRLTYEPNSFGEPLYRLPALGLQIRVGSMLPLFVDFAVSEDRRFVFIKGVKLFSSQHR